MRLLDFWDQSCIYLIEITCSLGRKLDTDIQQSQCRTFFMVPKVTPKQSEARFCYGGRLNKDMFEKGDFILGKADGR